MDDISNRMIRIVAVPNPFSYVTEGRAEGGSKEKYHPVRNPKGMISLGSAQNRLCGDLMLEQLQKLDLSGCDGASLLQYQDPQGIPALRRAVAGFLKDFTHSPQDIDPDKIRIYNGVTALIDVLAYTLCDEGDTILSPSPMFVGIVRIPAMRPNVNIHPIHLSSKPGASGEEPYELTVEHLEKAYAEATKQGKRVKALLLINPMNPLGTVYTKPQILAYLQFCHRYNLHVLLDEIYLCSVYDQTIPMCSIFSLREDEIPDKNKVHFMWSFGKDFSFNACHCSVMHSWNERVLEAVTVLADYQIVSSLTQIAVNQILNNKDWLYNVYFKTSHERLKEARDITLATLDEMGVAYIKPTAGFYIWANFNKFLGSSTYAEEKSLCCHLVSCGVTILPSSGFYGNEPGWFRVLFCNPIPELKEGLFRLKGGCASYKPGNASTIADDLMDDLADGLADIEILGAGSADCGTSESLESLVRSFQVSVRNSDWLQENTSAKWSQENPALSKVWMEELAKNQP